VSTCRYTPKIPPMAPTSAKPRRSPPNPTTPRDAYVYADRIAMHARHWLVRSAGTVATDAMAEVRTHLRFLVG